MRYLLFGDLPLRDQAWSEGKRLFHALWEPGRVHAAGTCLGLPVQRVPLTSVGSALTCDKSNFQSPSLDCGLFQNASGPRSEAQRSRLLKKKRKRAGFTFQAAGLFLYSGIRVTFTIPAGKEVNSGSTTTKECISFQTTEMGSECLIISLLSCFRPLSFEVFSHCINQNNTTAL